MMEGDERNTGLMDVNRGRVGRLSTVVTGVLMCTVVLSRTCTSILTPIWLDALNNDTTNNTCDVHNSVDKIDPFAMIFIVNTVTVVLLGVLLLVTKCLYPASIGPNETGYNKREFFLIGLSDTLGAVCLVYASSGCRTAPYLQSLAANFSIPATFIIRYLLLQKRPTCRKATCAMLVLVAEFTAMLPDIYPEIEPSQAKTDEGGATGIAGFLWPLCFFFGFVPMAVLSVVTEKAVKPANGTPRVRGTELNILYVLFWCYLFGLVTLICLFWTDIIPGFGMADGILDFANMFWFNIKCYIGMEGCRGMVNFVSVSCTLLLLVNRAAGAFFMRYLEGANYLVIITTVQTPLVFLFFTLFDENPVRWHPHAYLSTWLSIVALCIMLPAIYIYDTGAPEVVPSSSVTVEVECQTDDSSESDPLLPPSLPEYSISNPVRNIPEQRQWNNDVYGSGDNTYPVNNNPFE